MTDETEPTGPAAPLADWFQFDPDPDSTDQYRLIRYLRRVRKADRKERRKNPYAGYELVQLTRHAISDTGVIRWVYLNGGLGRVVGARRDGSKGLVVNLHPFEKPDADGDLMPAGRPTTFSVPRLMLLSHRPELPATPGMTPVFTGEEGDELALWHLEWGKREVRHNDDPNRPSWQESRERLLALTDRVIETWGRLPKNESAKNPNRGLIPQIARELDEHPKTIWRIVRANGLNYSTIGRSNNHAQ